MRYLRKQGDSHLWPWTPILAKRKDMTEVVTGVVDPDAPAAAQEKPETGGEDGGTETGLPSLAEQVLALVDKDELEAFGRQHGFEVDKRRSVVNIQNDILAHLGLS